MLRIAHLIVLIALATSLRAERVELDQYKAIVIAPEGEGWFRKGGPQLRTGEFAVYALNSTDKSRFAVAAIPGFPTSDIRHATVLNRIMEVMRAESFEPSRQRFGDQEDMPYVEVIGSATAENGDKFVMVARGILHNALLFITLHSAKGDDEAADQPGFMANIETLRFNVSASYSEFKIATEIPRLIPWHYRAYRGAAALAALLTLAFFGMLFITRTRSHTR